MGDKDLHQGAEASSLQGRLPSLTKKMRKLCVRLHKMNPAPELAEDLDLFTGNSQARGGDGSLMAVGTR